MARKVTLTLCVLGLAALSALLTGCGQDRPTLYVYNWGDYIDEDILEEFEKEFNMKVVYDTFSTNEDLYVKLKSGGSTYDVIFPSDYMLTRMLNENMLEKIDLSKIPNHRHIDESLMGTVYDPDNEYSLPYMWGTIGILYNTTMVAEPVDSWDALWDPRYAKEILMLDSQRDSMAAALIKLGYSINTLDKQELAEAGELLKQQKPLVLAYVVDEGKDKMVSGEAALALTWSGEAMYAISENDDLAYVIPKEGTNVWFDVMAIPKGAKNLEGALQFMDFLNRPEIALRNADYIGYATPNLAARAMLPEEIRDDPQAYPNLDALENAEFFVHLGDTLKDYDRIWTEVKAH
ncbi:MAG: spermidine/putrescine ABC transporter substrate-binding protein [Bacillota bacterium]|jgi:spermidine/putrescine transport system substrate-binding protein|nr:spermidine/putrescine ABC transporter substrate-binding protein [Bacillota bacterium]